MVVMLRIITEESVVACVTVTLCRYQRMAKDCDLLPNLPDFGHAAVVMRDDGVVARVAVVAAAQLLLDLAALPVWLVVVCGLREREGGKYIDRESAMFIMRLENLNGTLLLF